LDARSFALVGLAAVIAMDAPPASYLWQVADALQCGVTPAEMLGALQAISPEVGAARIASGAQGIMIALDLPLPT